MNTEQAKQIILHVAGKTQPRWKQYDTTWGDIDEIFISKGYEQGGFHCFKFVPLLEDKGIYSIHKLGSILEKYMGTRSYNRAFAGSLDSELYTGMREGNYGEEGRAFYSCVKDYLDNRVGNPGSSYHMQLWRMLICCTYLKKNYEGSFSFYLKKKYADFKRISGISDAEFLSMASDEWEKFKVEMKPWKELYGIGENVFDFIIGDTTEADFVKNAYKLDSANEYFLKVSGLYKVIGNLERESVINFLGTLNVPYTLRQVNKGIYTYCSDTEKENYGFCRDRWKCNDCGISGICEKNF